MESTSLKENNILNLFSFYKFRMCFVNDVEEEFKIQYGEGGRVGI